jgi:hypothetical protein
MSKLHLMLCSVALAFTACAVSPDESAAPVEGETVQTITRSVGAATETCTITTGACRVGQCELGPRDTFAAVTEVCCTGSTCTTERYRLCGC